MKTLFLLAPLFVEVAADVPCVSWPQMCGPGKACVESADPDSTELLCQPVSHFGPCAQHCYIGGTFCPDKKTCSHYGSFATGGVTAKCEKINCAVNKGGCQQHCVTNPDGSGKCTCDKGYKLNGKDCESLCGVCPLGESCKDPDDDGNWMCMQDCTKNKGGCDHQCVTYPDQSTACICYQDHKLDTDGKTCIPDPCYQHACPLGEVCDSTSGAATCGPVQADVVISGGGAGVEVSLEVGTGGGR